MKDVGAKGVCHGINSAASGEIGVVTDEIRHGNVKASGSIKKESASFTRRPILRKRHVFDRRRAISFHFPYATRTDQVMPRTISIKNRILDEEYRSFGIGLKPEMTFFDKEAYDCVDAASS